MRQCSVEVRKKFVERFFVWRGVTKTALGEFLLTFFEDTYILTTSFSHRNFCAFLIFLTSNDFPLLLISSTTCRDVL